MAILDAAAQVLGQKPAASMEDIAQAASVTRQTVYAHFASRDDLVNAVVDHVTEQAVAAIDTARLDELPPPEALVRFLNTGWEAMARYPLLYQALPPVTPEADYDRHQPILDRLERLIRRGQRSGDFDRQVSPGWLVATTIALGHAAGEEVGAGRMNADEATTAFQQSLLRLVGADRHQPP